MKNRNKSGVLVIIAVCGLILFTGFIQSDQGYINPVNSAGTLPGRKKIYFQEKAKYMYVGMEKCASACHNSKDMGFQYDIVRKSSHANAYKALTSGKAIRIAKSAGLAETAHENTVCLKCHTTGGGLDSTFFAATFKIEDGVTCEACHKGAFTSKVFIPKEDDCLKCHNNTVHRIPKFNFRNDCKRIAHPRPITKPENI
jgi:hypothetical protein